MKLKTFTIALIGFSFLSNSLNAQKNIAENNSLKNVKITFKILDPKHNNKFSYQESQDIYNDPNQIDTFEKDIITTLNNLEFELNFNQISSNYRIKVTNEMNLDLINIILNKARFNSNNEAWTLLNETKKVGEFTCKKAIKTIKNKKIIAWYSNELKRPLGPFNYGNLPGVILELNDSNYIYTAVKIDLNVKQQLDYHFSKNQLLAVN
ncbi:GLPGLI family protein [Tenacibaculum sp. MAR_2009_124]|uniref:GLPGLI family protein n=1 Tax=Tenacibaculum sp. MAR_2009_124 TaxID=1250059 RepID=UPI000899DBDB|nr:GLPGLI family protein [Tenacibaculum sp. MAR_2009_124]SEC64463.1 GLPGLI family protein [Tenacibaculum sp. MAR_2009_124]